MFFSSESFTQLHVAISLVAIASGVVVVFGLLAERRLDSWTAIFLGTTVATSVTGFLFPFHHVTPAHAVGAISLLMLAAAMYARYGRHLAGGWRRVYVIGAMTALYLNVFVLIVQAFQKVSVLRGLAPTQSEAPYLVAQVITLAAFVAAGWMAVVRFKDRPAIVAG